MLATERLNRLPAAERGITIADFLVPVQVGERLSSRVRHLSLIVVGALFIAFTAQIVIRLPNTPIPITGQTLGVLVAGGALGFRRGGAAALLYVVMGFFLPVYADHASGIATIASVRDGQLVFGATGGYLIGFVFAAAIVGRLAELGWDRRVLGTLAAMVIGDAVIYVFGLPWLMAALNLSPQRAVEVGLAPFLAGDALKILLATGLFPFAWWLVGRRPGER